MFGSNKNKKTELQSSSSTSSPSSGAINSIVQGTIIEGKVNANNDIRIDGELIGSLNCKGKVIIGPTGKFDGDVNCANAVVEGQFSGTLKVKELLNVKASGKITGDIDTNKLLVESGAVFNVNCNMAVSSVVGKEIKNKPQEKPKPVTQRH